MDVIVQFCLQNVPVLSLFSSYTPHKKLAWHTASYTTVECTVTLLHCRSSGCSKILRGWISRRVFIHVIFTHKKRWKIVKTHVYALWIASIGLTGLVLHWILMSNQVESCSCSGLEWRAAASRARKCGAAAALSSADAISGAT